MRNLKFTLEIQISSLSGKMGRSNHTKPMGSSSYKCLPFLSQSTHWSLIYSTCLAPLTFELMTSVTG